MLVLSRKPNQTIRIGDHIEIVVLRVSGDRVRLGVRAPRDIPVRRQELSGRRKVSGSQEGGQPDLGI